MFGKEQTVALLSFMNCFKIQSAKAVLCTLPEMLQLYTCD